MAARATNLHDALERLGRAIDDLDPNNRRTVAKVKSRFRAVVRTSATAQRHTGNLAATLGFDCSPPGHIRD